MLGPAHARVDLIAARAALAHALARYERVGEFPALVTAAVGSGRVRIDPVQWRRSRIALCALLQAIAVEHAAVAREARWFATHRRVRRRLFDESPFRGEP